MIELDTLFSKAFDLGASDILISSGSPPTLRINSELQRIKDDVLTPEDTKKFIYSILMDEQIKKFEGDKELDFSIRYKEHRFRGNAYMHSGSIAAAFRLIPNNIPSIEELNIPPIMIDLIEKPHGLILISGATGQGKSTSQASLINYINTHYRRHIITIEDPIEFVHHNEKSIVDQREVGFDTHRFSSALRHVLRQDPDVILVGEMRDLETIRSALTAAETGHLVISTLHTNDACQSIDRIIDVFPEEHKHQIRSQLSMTLLGIMSQRLVKNVEGDLTLASEILINNAAISNLIREGKTQMINSAIEINRKDGCMTLNQCLQSMIENVKITEEEALRYFSPKASRNSLI